MNFNNFVQELGDRYVTELKPMLENGKYDTVMFELMNVRDVFMDATRGDYVSSHSSLSIGGMIFILCEKLKNKEYDRVPFCIKSLDAYFAQNKLRHRILEERVS